MKVLKVLRVDWCQQDVEADVAIGSKVASSSCYRLRINYPLNASINRPLFAGVQWVSVFRHVNGIVV